MNGKEGTFPDSAKRVLIISIRTYFAGYHYALVTFYVSEDVALPPRKTTAR